MNYNADWIQTEIDYLKDKSMKLKKKRAKIKDQIDQLEEKLFDLKRSESAKRSGRLLLPECTSSSDSVLMLEPRNRNSISGP
jgi:predicted RNase H-like nuclease (RuvC/YqgF family)